ncbi:MAG TPA: hypothetical protein VF273_10330 [Pelobium sp.]
MNKETVRNAKNFDEFLAIKYGKIRVEMRDEFEEKAQYFVISKMLKEARKEANTSILSYLKSRQNWSGIKLIILFFILGLTNFGCKKERESIKVTTDEYYVKYIVKSSTAYIQGGKSIYRTAEIASENNSKQSFTFNNATWETIIGPVKKGFNASLKASYNVTAFGGPSRTYINSEIYVSKNNGPFALKASDISTTERFSASTIKYVINY